MKLSPFYTLPPSQPLLSVLTDFLLAQSKSDPFMLSRIHILLPTRRSVRKLKQLLLDQAPSSTLLLPKMQAIHDLTPPLGSDILAELPSALRLGLLFKLIKEEQAHLKAFPTIELAKTLEAFLDTLQAEEVNLSCLKTLIPESFAHHWQHSLKFLQMLHQKWPEIVQKQGYLEPWIYRRAVWDATTHLWEKSVPDYPIIAAGLNGAIPAIGRLLKRIAALPQGQVILPGFDLSLTPEDWRALKPSHPQCAYKRFFEREAIDPRQVQHWPAAQGRTSERDHTLSALMKTELTQTSVDLSGIRIIEVETAQDEAKTIALLIRKKLATAGQTIAVVSPDKQLGKQLKMELQRWNIDMDHSVGIPLTGTALGQLILQTAELKEFEEDPTLALSILKHPYTSLGFSRLDVLKYVRALEIQVLRAQKDLSDRSCSLLSRIANRCRLPQKESLLQFLDTWQRVTQSFLDLSKQKENSFKTFLETHLTLLEHLSSKSTLWESQEGQVLAPHLQNLLSDAEHFSSMTHLDYAHFLRVFLSKITLHEPFSHPRVQLLGPIEARFIQADLIILSSMNEGYWPESLTINPWLNSVMQQAVGLPDPDVNMGEGALDFTLALGNKNVLLTRALRSEGSPTTPSRWLLRLKAMATLNKEDLTYPHPIHTWRHLLDQPPCDLKIEEPAPCPPLSVRPLRLTISDIDLLLKDAYAFYAKNILKLSPLDPIESTLTPAHFGIWIHRILQHYPSAEALTGFSLPDETDPIWTYQFHRIKDWLLTQDEFKEPPQTLLTEEGLRHQWDSIEIVGKADRIQIDEDGIEIIDYKTGVIPTQKEMMEGHAPQLPLLAFLAQKTFKHRILKLSYWDLKNQEIHAIDDPEAMIDFYQKLLEKLFKEYGQADTVFKSASILIGARKNPYHHLKRVQEWLPNSI